MWIIQPGQGLGLPASKEIAFGLGAPFAAVAIDLHTPSWRHTADMQSVLLNEDEELMAILQAIIQSGMLN